MSRERGKTKKAIKFIYTTYVGRVRVIGIEFRNKNSVECKNVEKFKQARKLRFKKHVHIGRVREKKKGRKADVIFVLTVRYTKKNVNFDHRVEW